MCCACGFVAMCESVIDRLKLPFSFSFSLFSLYLSFSLHSFTQYLFLFRGKFSSSTYCKFIPTVGKGFYILSRPGVFDTKLPYLRRDLAVVSSKSKKKKERESDRDKKQVMKQTKGSRTSPHHHQQQTNTKQKKEGKNKVYTDPRDNASILLSHSLILTRLLPPLFLMCSRC